MRAYTLQLRFDPYHKKWYWTILDIDNKPMARFSKELNEIANETAHALNLMEEKEQ